MSFTRFAARLCLAALVASSGSCRRAEKNAITLPPSTHAISVVERAHIFDELWQTINDEYYDSSFNGVDWRGVRERYRPRIEAAKDDFEFYSLCELAVAELKDSHTQFEPAPSPDAGAPVSQGSPRIALAEVEGKTAVVSVEPGSLAERADVRAGMIVRGVNGRPVEEIDAQFSRLVAGASSARAYRNLLATSILYGRVWGVPRVLRLADPDGKEFDYEVRREPVDVSPRLESRRLASGFAYIKFDQWLKPVDQKFDEALDSLRDAPALVMDLRANGGGATDVMLNITSNFFAAPTYYGGFKTRDGSVDKYFTHKPARVYVKPIVILVDGRSASASETSALFMQEAGRVFVVGAPTAGATHNQRAKKLSDGSTLRYSIRAYLTPKGRDPEGTGVMPDDLAPQTISDLWRARDAALEAAEKKLRELTARGAGGTPSDRER
ncbi:MAG: S41 family peptidase [Pyrinomonadaceae bacterium]